ncbi:putative hydrolase or acyltransferase of alpha/beta superfamily [Sphaerochaeta pleomorpha str. Grapes]|uniref:Putative hydrolase or acyltransferase of alpha/beta superfamily n=1 Tax=Sphaerochaeta pleomorpha (strain ATCC BAA-1885 / DSM 22778 / Grapes) TaxID=158190 RepID=G8QV77_SPHPG|nr:alpha/beta hydrolase [Sphaerochaeta pleomorpha]AEV30392.1 putative hydrolase or acyltransferase of alpha/beta superfamily [Sphaerochaeta pleomorpha str. Grapes]
MAGKNKKPWRFHSKKAVVITVCMVVILLLILVLVYDGGTMKPLKDDQGNAIASSISEKIFVEINGTRLGMFIRSTNKDNPVLLFMHGGPGMPEYFLEEKYPTGLDSVFTVCWLEQRGAGLSYYPGMPAEEITVDQLVSDGIAVSSYLCNRFGKEKIYLMGHSWGSLIGVKMAGKAPGLYNAYIGIAQISDQYQSEVLAFDYMLDTYRREGNTRMAEKLEMYSPYMSQKKFEHYFVSGFRDTVMHDLGVGTMHAMHSVFSGIFIPVMTSNAYTLKEKINIWKAKSFLAKSTSLRKEMFGSKLPEQIKVLEIPTYFLSGVYDYTVSAILAKQFLSGITAPIKGFYTFDNSAHSPLFEESEKFVNIMLEDVLTGENNLSDKE